MFKGGTDAGITTQALGDGAEARARQHLQQQGLTFVQRHYRVAHGPGARAAEIDLIMREPDGTLVFVEVRARSSRNHGGAAASISPAKRRRLVWAAQHYLLRLARLPPCRFDVVAIDGDALTWIPGAFDAS